ncbi:MAG: extracellular solute-binding protein [Planctomycetes bacterium]|jgi:multiple sugar transport system substrate-binding protein|nr:extracellular solute-binding protein [Planctomycetota bacterium]
MFKKILIISVLFPLILTAAGCGTAGPSKSEAKHMEPVTLNYWRVFDGSDDFADIIAKYNQIHPFVTINYRKLRYDEYEEKLLEAFATDRGPDILSIHNTWIRKYQAKGFLEPMPDKITMAYPVLEGKIKKEVNPNVKTVNSINLTKLKNDFIDVVYDDVVIKQINEKTKKTEERVYGLPLSIDTLALFYNRDLFNNAGITSPPAYWNREFQQTVKKLTKQDNRGQIVQSGVALGGSDNIERSSDILSVLMMQNGTVMMSDNGIVGFHVRPEAFKEKNYNPGLDALRFYTDFANPAKEVYAWNKTLENSLNLFTQGKLAMMFGYSYMLPQIKAEAPKLNFSIAPLPQIEGNPQSINFANYWVEAVAKKSANAAIAWDFVQFAVKEKQVLGYLNKVKKPTALRALVDKQIEDQEIGVFAGQVLTAQSWYKGADASAAEAIMEEMIDNVAAGRTELENIISLAARKVQQTVAGE